MRTKLHHILRRAPQAALQPETQHETQPEHGQAILLIAMTAFVLLAFAGLAIDGGRVFYLKRETQKAADAGAIAAARAMCTVRDYRAAAYSIVAENGFSNDDPNDEVRVIHPPEHASIDIPPECEGCYIEVLVRSQIPPSFSGVVLDGDFQVTSYTVGMCNPDTTFGFSEDGLRALWTGSTTCQNTLDFTGSSNFISGGMHSNGDIHSGASGGGATVVGPVSYGGDLNIPDGKVNWVTDEEMLGGHRYTVTGACDVSCFTDMIDDTSKYPFENPFQLDYPIDYPLDYELEQFQEDGIFGALAVDAGQYYYFDICTGRDRSLTQTWLEDEGLLQADGTLADGLYYSECDINLSVNNLKGTVTLVAEGSIQISGAEMDLHAYTDNLLAFTPDGNNRCTAKVVKFSGSANNWTGNIFAPGGMVEMSASSNTTTHGCIVAYTIDLSGSSQSIECDVDYQTRSVPGIAFDE